MTPIFDLRHRITLESKCAVTLALGVTAFVTAIKACGLVALVELFNFILQDWRGQGHGMDAHDCCQLDDF
jgi:hypothetical protein